MGVAEDLVGVVNHATAGNRRSGAHDHRWPMRFPQELVIAHPLHPNRLAPDRARQQRRIKGNIVGTVVSITARAFNMDAANCALF